MSRITSVLALLSSPVLGAYTWDETANALPQFATAAARSDFSTYMDGVTPAIATADKTCLLSWIDAIKVATAIPATKLSGICADTTSAAIVTKITLTTAPTLTTPCTGSTKTLANTYSTIADYFLGLKTAGTICAASSAFTPSILTALAAVGLALI